MTRMQQEQKDYSLLSNREYIKRFADYTAEYLKKAERYNYGAKCPRDIPTKNMIKALRMLPWMNSADDWSRLHAAEKYTR